MLGTIIVAASGTQIRGFPIQQFNFDCGFAALSFVVCNPIRGIREIRG
jgi:hypothetical protein